MSDTPLRRAYDFLAYFSAASHREMCSDLIRQIGSQADRPTVVDWFVESFETSRAFANVEQPFVDTVSLRNRKAIGPESTGTGKIAYLLQQKGTVCVDGGPEGYSFCYVNREIPPARKAGAGMPTSGAGGIDYIAKAAVAPVLGEIKVKSDKTAFYAFIQLLTYASEMATENQIIRANCHQTFGIPMVAPCRFDLHILLADFSTSKIQEEVIALTKQLATSFKRLLAQRKSAAASTIGNILCLRMDTKEFVSEQSKGVTCVWRA